MVVLNSSCGRITQTIATHLADLPGAHLYVPTRPQAVLPGFTAVAAERKALEGASDLVLVPSLDQRRIEEQAAFALLARSAGVERIHLITLAGADSRSPVMLLRWLGMLERELLALGLPTTVFRCTPFMQDIGLFTRRDETGLSLVGPFRDTTFPWLHAEDAAEILAARVRAKSNDNLVCQLSGPEEVNFETIAALLEEEVGEPVHYVDLCRPEAEGALEARGFSPTRIRAMVEYWDFLVSRVVCASCCDTVRQLLGRKPRTLRDYLATLAQELRPELKPAPRAESAGAAPAQASRTDGRASARNRRARAGG